MAGPALSFGVELEFLAVHDFASIDGEPDYTIVKRKIYSRMLEAGIPATGYESAGEDLSYVPTYSRWRVEHDSSLLLSPEERDHLGSGWKEELIEISSRKLHLHNDWTSEIAKLLDVLRSIEGENYTTTPCPRTICGNAHISPRMGAYREAIDTEARGRDATYSDIEALESYEDLCAFFKIGVPVQEGCIRVDDFEATPDWENPCTVFNCEDKKDKFGDYECHHDVVELNGHRCMVNLDNLCSKAKNSDQVVGGTIEFRAHAGTLDFMTIRSWVLLLSVLMRYSTMAPTAEFLQLLLNGLHRTFGLRKLLEALGCPEEVVNFYCTEDGSIGVLPCGDTRSLVTPATTLALFEYNDDSYDGRSSPTALASTIRDKDNADEYGILADDICPPPPQADIEPLLQHALTQILAEKGVAVAAGEASMDLARERVLAGLAEKYALECEELEDLSMLGKLSLEDGKEDQ